MNTLRTTLLTGGLLLCMTHAQADLLTAPFTYYRDSYWGVTPSGYGDVIGYDSYFNITGAVATAALIGSKLQIDFVTDFMQKGLGTYSSSTNTTLSQKRGIGAGDLFFSIDGWDPYGTEPYLDDNLKTGTTWEYALALDNRWSSTGSKASLYKLPATDETNYEHAGLPVTTCIKYKNNNPTKPCEKESVTTISTDEHGDEHKKVVTTTCTRWDSNNPNTCKTSTLTTKTTDTVTVTVQNGYKKEVVVTTCTAWNTDGTCKSPSVKTTTVNDYQYISTAEDFLSSGIYRHDQAVAVNTGATGVTNTGFGATWTSTTATINGVADTPVVRFIIDLSGTELLGKTLGVHWALTCANDVIEFQLPLPSVIPPHNSELSSVPEPNSLLLLIPGLVWLQRRFNHSVCRA